MTTSNEHITVKEVLQVLHAQARPEKDEIDPRVEGHLRQCEHCGQVLQEYRRFMSKLHEFGKAGQAAGECPAPSAWGELAAGIVSQEEAAQYMRHAASCASCTDEFLYALDALGTNAPPPPDLQQLLTTATPEWQKRFAANIASNKSSIRPIAQPISSGSGQGWHFIFPRWAYAAIAAVVFLAAGIGLYFRLHTDSSETLIQEAYAQQRTVEMRIPGARYGPIQAQRAAGQSQISQPRVLLEAEVQIKRRLEKRPDDPELLREKAEADLLNWNYQAALGTLNHADRLKSSSELQVDLATAYFERAEATANPADYEAGLQSLGEAIRLKPDDPAALFNRAILNERLYFYGRAVADWEAFLKIEKDPGWRNEAEQRLKEIRERQQQSSHRRAPAELSPAQFEDTIERASESEEYLEEAERRILPQISEAQNRDPYYRAAAAVAKNLQTFHSDLFFKDLIASASSPEFHQAANLLSQSLEANRTGQFESGFGYATQAAIRFRRSGDLAGSLAADFQRAYALQFESRANPCRELAGEAAREAQRHNYSLLEIELLLEQSICANMQGELGPAKELVERAIKLAQAHDYQNSYLRGLTQFATLESDAGDESRAWSAVQEGLGLFWKSDLPPVRAYSFYAVLDRMAERLGHANVQFAALTEALFFRSESSDRLVDAAAHARLGDAAMRIGELQVAQAQLEEAEHIFASEPATDSVRWRELEARINLARVQSLQTGETRQTAAALLDSLPEVQQLSNRYLEFQYYDTLSELKLRDGDLPAGRRFLEKAIAIAQMGARSLTSWQERISWMDQHRQPFALMTELWLESGEKKRALDEWEEYRQAGAVQQTVRPPAAAKVLNVSNASTRYPPSQSSSETWIVTYAFGPRGLMIWVRHQGELHSASVPLSLRDVQRTTERLISECSRPDSDAADLLADSQSLYASLIQPIKGWLPESGHLVIEPDGILGILPFEALMDTSQTYLGTRYTITMALAVRGSDAGTTGAIAVSDHAVIVAVPAADAGVPVPPPGALAEAKSVAGNFDHPEVLQGRDANVKRVESALRDSTIFHFAGHATLGRSGAAVLMADGLLDSSHAGIFDGNKLRKLKLAVFSACATAQPSEISESSSLVSEFLQAGTQNVVASRWNVDSMATTDFVKLFYRSLLSGSSVAESLQSAANAFRNTTARSHPYYWAAFSAFGRT